MTGFEVVAPRDPSPGCVYLGARGLVAVVGEFHDQADNRTFSELWCDAANPTESMPKLPPKTARQPRLERRVSTDSQAQSRGFIHSAIRFATDGGPTGSSGDCGPECGH